MKKVKYGIDAPGIMLNLIFVGFVLLAIAFVIPIFTNQIFFRIIGYIICIPGIISFILGIAMLLYGLSGKYRTRDLMLSKINWKGDELVLDIGTGQGLLMNGAAKFLTSGKSTGIDIWSSKDLSNNTVSKTLSNAEIEGVRNKIEVLNMDGSKLTFADNYFDVVLSLLCIHNIEPKEEQEKACFEIARVLKPGGKAFIGDYIPTTAYANAFTKAGLIVISSKPYFSTALALMWIVEVTK